MSRANEAITCVNLRPIARRHHAAPHRARSHSRRRRRRSRSTRDTGDGQDETLAVLRQNLIPLSRRPPELSRQTKEEEPAGNGLGAGEPAAWDQKDPAGNEVELK